MKVRLARTAGFCMGVRRAMEMVLAEANKGKGPIYTYGPLIHNRQVLKLLESKGIRAVQEINGLKKGTILIRAHGIPPDQRRVLKTSGLKILDATCPKVARVQAIIRYHCKKGYHAIIAGDSDHAEVIGLMGYTGGNGTIIGSPVEVEDIPEKERLFVVAQTTQDVKVYREIMDAVKKRFPTALIFNTICDATHNRQQEVRAFAGQVDGLVVVGGYHSGNTRRLVQVAKDVKLPAFHVETAGELDRNALSKMEEVGVTAGASTPNWMIREVVKEIEAIQSIRETVLGKRIKKFLRFLFLSNLGVAAGALFLARAAMTLEGRTPDLVHPTLAFFYIYAMHVVNRFLDKGASTYNDPDMADFYRKNKGFLMFTSFSSLLGAFVLSFRLGPAVFIAITGLSLLGILYGIPVVPGRYKQVWRYTKIKDIPGSKTFSMALAWGAVISLLPLLEPGNRLNWPVAVSFFFVFSVAYIRSALFDLFQAQGDLIVGGETLPVVLGEKQSIILLKWFILFSTAVVLFSPLLGLTGPFSYLLGLCYLSLALCLYTYERKWLYPGLRLEAMVEGTLYLAGILALFWGSM